MRRSIINFLKITSLSFSLILLSIFWSIFLGLFVMGIIGMFIHNNGLIIYSGLLLTTAINTAIVMVLINFCLNIMQKPPRKNVFSMRLRIINIVIQFFLIFCLPINDGYTLLAYSNLKEAFIMNIILFLIVLSVGVLVTKKMYKPA